VPNIFLLHIWIEHALPETILWVFEHLALIFLCFLLLNTFTIMLMWC